MNVTVGNQSYGAHLTTWRWGLALHVEWRGETYGGQWSL